MASLCLPCTAVSQPCSLTFLCIIHRRYSWYRVLPSSTDRRWSQSLQLIKQLVNGRYGVVRSWTPLWPWKGLHSIRKTLWFFWLCIQHSEPWGSMVTAIILLNIIAVTFQAFALCRNFSDDSLDQLMVSLLSPSWVKTLAKK